MSTSDLQTTINATNERLHKHREMRFLCAWRSVGTNIFLEFGAPVIKHVVSKTRPAKAVIRGEASIGIHADSWRLCVEGNTVLDAITVTNENVSLIGGPHFRDAQLPTFAMSSADTLTMSFDGGVFFAIRPNEYSGEENDILDEVSINLDSEPLSFNFKKGFYAIPP